MNQPDYYFWTVLDAYTIQQGGYTIKDETLPIDFYRDVGILRSLIEATQDKSLIGAFSSQMVRMITGK